MHIPRFFITAPQIRTRQPEERLRMAASSTLLETNDIVTILDPGLNRQMKNVLRMKSGQKLVLLDGTGMAYQAQLRGFDNHYAEVIIGPGSAVQNEPSVDVTVGLALIKADRFEWCLEKLTEIGVRKIVPLTTERSVVRMEETKGAKTERKLARWQAIVKEAAEQSERSVIPHIEQIRLLESFLNESSARTDNKFICCERMREQSLSQALEETNTENKRVRLLVGPEGGFTEDELAMAMKHQWLAVSLGSRILRAETAAIAALVQVISRFER